MDANTYAAMAETAAKVLRHNPTLRLAAVHIHGATHGRRDEFRNMVCIQAPAVDGVRQMVLWALEFGSPLAVVDKGNYVEISTEAVVDGDTVVVWDILSDAMVERLLSALRLSSVESLAVLDPATVLAVDEPSEVAS